MDQFSKVLMFHHSAQCIAVDLTTNQLFASDFRKVKLGYFMVVLRNRSKRKQVVYRDIKTLGNLDHHYGSADPVFFQIGKAVLY